MPQVTIGSVDLVNTSSYHHHGSSNVVNVSEGGHVYHVEVKGGEHNGVDLTSALATLNAHIAAGCMHNSEDRVDAPKCHEETREAVQDDIFGWIDHGSADEVLWLTGPAGSGKSAIMGTISDKLRERKQLAATYYFSSFSGSLERKSKRGFVTTLAYQLYQCEELDDRVAPAILSAIQKDPAVFRMSLNEQMERLVLRPLRSAHEYRARTKPRARMTIVVDGVDECGEPTYVNSARSREDDQIEVLSVLLQALKDPAFSFRIVVASRPENCIRRFFTDADGGRVNEVFLDDKYSPDDDVRRFLKSKFAELCRRHGMNPSTWPPEEVIAKLVSNASGQFIYVATVLRFIDTPGTLPHTQLEIVLSIKPRPRTSSNPFSLLDALYTSILQSSPYPRLTVLWLKAEQFLNAAAQSRVPGTNSLPLRFSVWTLGRLFESTAGQAQMILGLPSLVYIVEGSTSYGSQRDSYEYGITLKVPTSLIPDVGWNSDYAFYHKTFLDYLNDPSRCGAAFPVVSIDEVKQWVWGRFARTLKCDGPEVSVDPALTLVFKRCFIDLLMHCATDPPSYSRIKEKTFSKCNPAGWLNVEKKVLSVTLGDHDFPAYMFVTVHKDCRFYRPCNPGCKLWREAISELPVGEWHEGFWSTRDFLLDRYCIKRLRPIWNHAV